MPEVTVPTEAPSVFNTAELSQRMHAVFTQHFGAERVVELKPIMASEDFSRYWQADKTKQSMLFWVGGTPRDKWDAASGDETKLPSLHSAYFAPDAEKVISTATEAMSVAALDVLKKG